MGYAIRVVGDERVDLGAIDPRGDGKIERTVGEERFRKLAGELGELQELLYAAGSESVLIVLQGLDTSGKDGTIRHVFSEVNTQGTRVVAFKVPTAQERAHDFLWRIHPHTPERGAMVIFNRSHYEDVLVARVHDLVPEEVWRARYAHINAFERLVTDSGTILVKFYLHISKEEQEERLLAREHDVAKAWKLSSADWIERRSWGDYIAAFEDALRECNAPHAPWYVVPADRKWLRNLAVAEVLVDALRPHRERWLAALRERGNAELAAIRAARETAD
jgi:PPK2 family polyphosphate:nucleotide phosphotransferase